MGRGRLVPRQPPIRLSTISDSILTKNGTLNKKEMYYSLFSCYFCTNNEHPTLRQSFRSRAASECSRRCRNESPKKKTKNRVTCFSSRARTELKKKLVAKIVLFTNKVLNLATDSALLSSSRPGTERFSITRNKSSGFANPAPGMKSIDIHECLLNLD